MAWRASLRRGCALISFCELSASPVELTSSTPLHFDLYTEDSRKIREVLAQVSLTTATRANGQYDENLMMAGLDEGYLK